jgi:hypothetical protein
VDITRYATFHVNSPLIAATLLVIPILMVCSCVERSIGYASAAGTITTAAEVTKTAGNDDNIKSDVEKKDCKDNSKDNSKDNNNDDGKSDACSESKSKDSVTDSSGDTTVTPQNNDDDNKKHKDPFLLPFP